MTSNLIYEIFNEKFLIPFGLKCYEWFPNGKNSIRVVLTDKNILIFHFESYNNWKIETMPSFLKFLKEVNNSKHL